MVLQGLVGTSGIASCGLLPIGKVRLGENTYYAHFIKHIDVIKDTKVKVVEKRGLSLYVKQIEEESAISKNLSQA